MAFDNVNMNVLRYDSISCRAMFTNLLASILFSTLVITSVAGAGLSDSVDGNDSPVVTKRVVYQTAKTRQECTDRAHCTVNVQAYSGYNSTTCHGANEGFVKLNGKTVWSAGWCSSLDNSRGLTIVDVDAHSCTVNSVQTFDTHDSELNAVALVTYLQQLPPGAVIVGVTGDEAMSKLGPALETLKSMRVDVRDVRERGNFAFVLQKDYSFEPIVTKGLDVNVAPAVINVQLEAERMILIQQHYGGTTFFDRLRYEYVYGFGEETGNYWLGLNVMHNLTVDGNFKLRVELQAKANSQWYWVEYETFRVLDHNADYAVWVDRYSGTAGNAMQYHNVMKFSTKDRDKDTYCAGSCATDATYGNNGGFWYSGCGGVYINSPIDGYNGFTWLNLPIAGTAPYVYKLLVSRMYLVWKA